jgi:hypothetical protein
MRRGGPLFVLDANSGKRLAFYSWKDVLIGVSMGEGSFVKWKTLLEEPRHIVSPWRG